MHVLMGCVNLSNLENVDATEVELPPGALPGLVFVEAPFDWKNLTSKEGNYCRNLEFNLTNQILRQIYRELDRFTFFSFFKTV